MKRPLVALLATCLIINMGMSAEAKWFSKKDKDNSKVQSIDIIKEFPPEATEIQAEQTVVNDADSIKKELKTPAAKEKTSWKYKSKKPDYSEYQLPTEGFVTNRYSTERSRASIQGSVSKSMELNLADCLELALVNNPKIKSSYSGAAAENSKKLQTISNYSPRATLQTGFSRAKPDGGSFGFNIDPLNQYLIGTIGVRQLIYDFGITQNQYSINKLEYENSKENIDATVNNIIYQVKDKYYYLLFALEQERVQEEAVDYFEHTYHQARAFWEIGTKAKIDMLIAEANLENARADLIQASCDVEVAIAGLNNAMGLPFIPSYTVSEALPYSKTSIGMREAVEIANKSRPDLKVALINVKMADEYVKLAKKSFFPAIEFSGNVSRGKIEHRDSRSWYDMGAYLSFPTVNPLLIKGQVDQAKHLYAKQQYDSKSAVNDIYYEIRGAHEQVMFAQERIPASQAAVRKAREGFDIASGRYRVGEGDAIELKDSQLQYQKAQLAYYTTLYQYNSAKANLERAIGQTLKNENAPTENAMLKDDTKVKKSKV